MRCVTFVYITSQQTSNRLLSQSLWWLHGEIEGLLIVTSLDIFVKVINLSVTYPQMLLIEKPVYMNL